MVALVQPQHVVAPRILLLLLFKDLIFYVHTCFARMYVCEPRVHSTCRGQKRASYLLELEL